MYDRFYWSWKKCLLSLTLLQLLSVNKKEVVCYQELLTCLHVFGKLLTFIFSLSLLFVFPFTRTNTFLFFSGCDWSVTLSLRTVCTEAFYQPTACLCTKLHKNAHLNIVCVYTHAQRCSNVQIRAQLKIKKVTEILQPPQHCNQSLKQINGMWFSPASTAENERCGR